jgi:hypothetical protein
MNPKSRALGVAAVVALLVALVSGVAAARYNSDAAWWSDLAAERYSAYLEGDRTTPRDEIRAMWDQAAIYEAHGALLNLVSAVAFLASGVTGVLGALAWHAEYANRIATRPTESTRTPDQ